MYYRRKVLLALLQVFGGSVNSTDFQKYLFLFREAQVKPSFDFVPYKFGCFSFQSYADKRTMIKYGLIEDAEGWVGKDKTDYVSQLELGDREALLKTKQQHGTLKGKNLIRHVYLNHPYYAIKSEIAARHLNKAELATIERQKPQQSDAGFFTIGYEGGTLEAYLNKLIRNNIHLLCDVRRNALSMKYGFSKGQLKEACEKLGIGYVHIPELGIESAKRQNLDSRKDYEILFEEYEKKVLPSKSKELRLLYELFLKYGRIAITCFEADPALCHRHKIAKQIEKFPKWEFNILHL